MTEYWFRRVKDGEKVIKTTIQEIARAAQREADQWGTAVQVFSGGAGRKAAHYVTRKNPGPRKVRRNPVLAGHNFTGEEWKITAKRKGRPFVQYAPDKKTAEREMQMLFREGYHSFTLHRTKAPVKEPTRSMRRNPTPSVKWGPWITHHTLSHLDYKAAQRIKRERHSPSEGQRARVVPFKYSNGQESGYYDVQISKWRT